MPCMERPLPTRKVEKKKAKPLIMTGRNVYSKAYHRVFTRTNSKVAARKAGSQARREWEESQKCLDPSAP